MSTGIIHTSRGDGVEVVTIDRPRVRNALDRDAYAGLAETFAALDRDTTRAVVLTGGDEWFSAGGDITSMGGAGDRVTAPAARPRLAQRAAQAIVECRAPVIAAVEGYAIGAGWGLALACDLVVASRTSFFAGPFVRRGLVPDTGVAWTLAQRLGHHRAARLLFFADRVPAPEAADLGLVTHLTDAGRAQATALELAGELASGPADSLALTKHLLRNASALTFDQFLREEYVAIALNGHGADAAEGQRAFVEKRPPEFG
jgi:2-(1,2-epoxy-1,2-dihydrophenyl)acetyl-CoA isomerase